jgi:hypothetical protein
MIKPVDVKRSVLEGIRILQNISDLRMPDEGSDGSFSSLHEPERTAIWRMLEWELAPHREQQRKQVEWMLDLLFVQKIRVGWLLRQTPASEVLLYAMLYRGRVSALRLKLGYLWERDFPACAAVGSELIFSPIRIWDSPQESDFGGFLAGLEKDDSPEVWICDWELSVDEVRIAGEFSSGRPVTFLSLESPAVQQPASDEISHSRAQGYLKAQMLEAFRLAEPIARKTLMSARIEIPRLHFWAAPTELLWTTVALWFSPANSARRLQLNRVWELASDSANRVTVFLRFCPPLVFSLSLLWKSGHLNSVRLSLGALLRDPQMAIEDWHEALAEDVGPDLRRTIKEAARLERCIQIRDVSKERDFGSALRVLENDECPRMVLCDWELSEQEGELAKSPASRRRLTFVPLNP